MEYLFTTKVMIYYFSIIVALVLLGVFALRRRLSFLEKIRKKRLSNVKSEDLLSSHINNNINEAQIKQQPLENLKKRFSITRRAIYLAIIFTALLVAVAPLIGNFSPTLISVIVAGVSVILGMAVAWATSAADGWMLSIDIRRNLLLEFKKRGIQTHRQNIAINNLEKE